MEIIANDSPHALNAPTTVLLIGSAVTLAIVTLWLVRIVARPQIWPARLMVGLAAIWLFEWLSPQAFHEFYRLALPDIPEDWVARLPGPFELGRMMSFAGDPGLAGYAHGVLAWLILAVALVPRFGAPKREKAPKRG